MTIIINSFEEGVVSNKEIRILRGVAISFDLKGLVVPKLFPTKESGQKCVQLCIIILIACCSVYVLKSYTPEQVISILRLVVDLMKSLK